MAMDNPQLEPNRAVDRLHYAKNIIGLAGFTVLFLYCAYLLLTTSKPNDLLVYGIVMFVLLLTIIRSARRVLAIRRILSTGQK
ncbi:hypothetical protein ASD53_09645 [Lysobacter sp. Root559]|nr:hypothetical protein ASD53_09645 [Lysobacter sp. Root559]KRC34007.1 hypothetical protein ASE10_13830 [Lysobacter sp. Root76]KRD69341.1 hypothetical protein ASE45_09270 [Lysobacter sp. Root96]